MCSAHTIGTTNEWGAKKNNDKGNGSVPTHLEMRDAGQRNKDVILFNISDTNNVTNGYIWYKYNYGIQHHDNTNYNNVINNNNTPIITQG